MQTVEPFVGFCQALREMRLRPVTVTALLDASEAA
jgi:hypothetical protein